MDSQKMGEIHIPTQKTTGMRSRAPKRFHLTFQNNVHPSHTFKNITKWWFYNKPAKYESSDKYEHDEWSLFRRGWAIRYGRYRTETKAYRLPSSPYMRHATHAWWTWVSSVSAAATSEKSTKDSANCMQQQSVNQVITEICRSEGETDLPIGMVGDKCNGGISYLRLKNLPQIRSRVPGNSLKPFRQQQSLQPLPKKPLKTSDL